METVDPEPYQLAERRIAQLTLALGGAAAIGGWLLFSWRVGAGVLIGALLAWVNFCWLKSGLDAVVRVSTAQADSTQPKLSVGSLAKLFGRYTLIVVLVCATFILFKIPILSMLVGLCALGAATMVASVYEVIRSWD